MSEYIKLIVLSVLMAWLIQYTYVGTPNSLGTKSAHRIFGFILFAMMALFIGLRTHYNDTSTYRAGYAALQRFPEFWDGFQTKIGENPGFHITSGLLKTFGVSTQGFVLFFSAVTIGLFLLFLRWFSCNFTLTVFLFFMTGMYMLSAAAIKQNMAVAICLLALPFALRRKWVPFVLLIGFAATFHPYALMYLAVPLLTFKPWHGKTYLLLIGFVCAGFALESLLGSIIDITAMLGDEYSVESLQGEGINVFRVLVCNVPTFLTFVYQKELFYDSKPRDNLMINLCMINGAIMFVGLFGTANYFGRLANYFTIFQAIALPWIVSKLRDPKTRRLLTYAMVSCYAMYFLYSNTINGSFDMEFNRITLREYLVTYLTGR